jgi:hypothetical protein
MVCMVDERGVDSGRFERRYRHPVQGLRGPRVSLLEQFPSSFKFSFLLPSIHLYIPYLISHLSSSHSSKEYLRELICD